MPVCRLVETGVEFLETTEREVWTMETHLQCDHPGCRDAVVYKIAAVWRDTRFRELKNYGFSCRDHVGDVFRDAQARWQSWPRVEGEIVEEVGIYDYAPGMRDSQLDRLWNLEKSYRS